MLWSRPRRHAPPRDRRSFRRVTPCAILIALLLPAAPSAAETWRFVVTGDSRGKARGVDAAVLGETARAVVAEKADFVLFTGDLVTGLCDRATLEAELVAWRDVMGPVYRAGIGVYPVQGNHETGARASAAAWNHVFSGPFALPANGPAAAPGITYAVRHRNALVLALDQTNREVDLAWITAQLAGGVPEHVFVMGHYPAFKVQHEDNLDDDPPARNAFWRTLARAGARVYFAGHDHFFDHARIDDGDGDPSNDLQQIILGAGGAPIYADGTYDGDNGIYRPVRVAHDQQYGYALVEIDGPQVTVTWKRRVAKGSYRAAGVPFRYTVAAPVAAGPVSAK